jgi:hypothetical protein
MLSEIHLNVYTPPPVSRLDSWRVATLDQTRVARGIHGLPKVSPGPVMPDPPMPCGRATPGVACPQGGPPAAVFNPLGYPTPYEPAGQRVAGHRPNRVEGEGAMARPYVINTHHPSLPANHLRAL